MELEYLKEFIVMSKYEDLFEASEQLYVSPSSLSRHIKMIEDELNVKLFERTSRSMRLNQQGEIFLNYAKYMVQMEQNYKNILRNNDIENINTIHVATLASGGRHFITDLIEYLKSRHPDYVIYVHEADTVENWERIRRMECDFAFVLEHKVEHAGINRKIIGCDHLVAVMPEAHALARCSRVSALMLSKEKLLLFFKGSYMYRLSYGIFEKTKMQPRIAATCFKGETLTGLVKQGMGIAIMTETEAQEYAEGQITYRLLDPEMKIHISLVYRQKEQMREIERDFLKYVDEFLHNQKTAKEKKWT